MAWANNTGTMSPGARAEAPSTPWTRRNLWIILEVLPAETGGSRRKIRRATVSWANSDDQYLFSSANMPKYEWEILAFRQDQLGILQGRNGIVPGLSSSQH